MFKFKQVRFAFALLSACFLLLIPACGGSHVNKGNYDRIKEGMTEAEVRSILGPPGNTAGSTESIIDPKKGTTTTSKSQMSWADGERSITIDFTDGKVSGKKQQGL